VPLGGEVERDGAAVAGVGRALQQTGVDEPVDHLGHRAGRDPQPGGEVGRPQPRREGHDEEGAALVGRQPPRGQPVTPGRPETTRDGGHELGQRRLRGCRGIHSRSLALTRMPHYEVTSLS